MTGRLEDLAWPRRTERLTIRRAEVADAEPTWRFRRHESVGRWLTTDCSDPDRYREHFEVPARLAKTLVVERAGAVIGDLMLSVEDGWAQLEIRDLARGVQAELGWTLDPAYGGRGYATEAVAELIRVAFDGLRLRRVTASCFADNVSSWRLMERLGMRREEHALRDSLHRSGRWLDGFRYALLAEEWRARQAASAAG